MEEYIDKGTYDLSLGQKQRITIAGVLAVAPKLIIMDEPTAMLDTEGKEEVRKIVKNLKEKGFTIIYITNIIEEISISDRIIMLKEGQAIKDMNTEDINIEQMEPVAEILKSDVCVSNLENKISYNKVLSKADVTIKILYITESSQIAMTQATIPVMNFIDMEKVTDEDTCHTDYKIRNMLFKPNAKEMKSINCQIDFEVSCEVYKSRTIELVQDMYGIDKNITFNQKTIQIQTKGESEKQVVNVSENVLVEDIRSLYDVDCKVNITNKTPSGNSVNYEGEVCGDIYYDTGNNLGVKSAKIPFMVKLDCDTDDIEIDLVRKNFKLNNEEVACDLDIEIKPNATNQKTIRLIEDVQEEEYTDDSDYAMIVYFVKEGDTIWNIARDFRVTMDSIIQTNHLQDTKIHTGEKLYIMK